jgi:GNAT superfamily N-acetyltransferase
VSLSLQSGDRLGGIEALADLEPLAETIFGRGERVPGWFARKLVRECVDPAASALLLDAGEVVGMALVGRPPSLGRLARGSGVGVHPRLRGRGAGARLLEHASMLARARGMRALEFWAEPARVDWYRRNGFVPTRACWTLLVHATGSNPIDPLHPSEAHACESIPPTSAATLWSWTREAWLRTPSEQRFVLACTHERVELRAWLSCEGRARLVQRLDAHDASGEPGHVLDTDQRLALLARVRDALPRGTPLLAFPCPAQREWTSAALARGWSIAQRSWLVRRELA